MKILRVKIKRTQDSKKTHYDYPLGYDAQKITVMVYESMSDKGMDDIKNRGNTDEYLLGLVEDEDAPQFLKSPNIEELTKQQAISIGNMWRTQIIKTTDQDRVNEILSKVVRGKLITQEDKNALDPDKPELGIRRSESFEQSLNQRFASGRRGGPPRN